ncbi:MAG: polysaccharide pyruvyl transferase family protein [Patescibacteria group bacterium]
MPKKSRVIILGSHGTGNIGDEAILMAMLKSINDFLPPAMIKVISRCPEAIKKYTTANTCTKKTLLFYFEAVWSVIKADMLIVGGGGIIQDQTSFFNLLYYVLHILLAKLFRVKTVLYSVGVGPISRKSSMLLIKMVIAKCDVITVRDAYSAKVLADCGVQPKKIKICPDPVFFLKPIISENREGIMRDISIGPNNNLVGLSLRPWMFALGTIMPQKSSSLDDRWFDKYQALISEIIKTVDYFNARGVSVVMMPFEIEQDVPVLSHVYKKVKNRSSNFLIQKKYDPYSLLSLYSRMSFSMCMRFHSIVFSIISEKPFISINYMKKSSELLDNNDLGDLGVALDECRNGNFFNRTIELYNNRNQITEKVKIAKKKIMQIDRPEKSIIGLFNKNPLSEKMGNDVKNLCD